MKLADLLQPWLKDTIPDCDIKGLQNNSRLILQGDLFIAYPGDAADGRKYINEAITAGAAALIYDPKDNFSLEKSSLEIPCIAVDHLATQLSDLAARFFENPAKNFIFTGVTGTNGKTTIAYQLAQAHELLGQKAAYIGTLGQGKAFQLQPLQNTTPDALCLQKLFHDYQTKGIKQVCMEVSSHALSQQRVNNIPFGQAIFTNLTHDHLDYHQTMEAYAAAKAKLFAWEGLQWAIVNQDDAHAKQMLAAVPFTAEKLSYGILQPADIHVQNWHMDMQGSQLEVHSPWGEYHLVINALGQFNIYNCLAVFSSLLAYGYSPQEVCEVMALLKAAPGRMEIVASNPYIIVDYAHTPDALENILTTLNQLKKGKLWAVFGCGGDRDKTKRPLMGKIASQHADRVVITSDNPRTEDPLAIINDISAGISSGASFYTEIDRIKAIHRAIDCADKEDIIVIAGKGHESYQEIEKIRHPFSDQAIVREYCQR